MALERAKRMVEQKKDVLLVLDSLTRLMRAYAATVPPSGRQLYGVVDVLALQRARRFFGAGRSLRGTGSLTTVVTILTETDSELNDILIEDVLGMANAEIHLQAIDGGAPQLDVERTAAWQAERFLGRDEIEARRELRRRLTGEAEPASALADLLARYPTNDELLGSLGAAAPVPEKRRGRARSA
jgi:transcription termination factor Rho